MKSKLQAGDALLIVDPQYDFLPGGSLAIADGHKILPVLNDWIKAAQKAGIPIIISRDWHPAHHKSFKERGGPWPSHCVQNTHGAKFHKDLKFPNNAIIVNKAFNADKDAYSALEGVTDTEGVPLPEKLRQLKIKRLWIGGLAFDYCVQFSSLDARKSGFEVRIILPATKAIADETAQDTFKKLANADVAFELDSEPDDS